MSECVFCRQLAEHKEVGRLTRKDAAARGYGDYHHEYTVALVIRSWYGWKGKRCAGRTVDFRYRGIGYKLNYCPECGRYLRRRKQ